MATKSSTKKPITKKETSKPSVADKKDNVSKKKVESQSDNSAIYIVSFSILAFAIISFLAIISYFIYWKEDQSISQWSSLFVRDPEEANNFMGRFGAILGQLFVGRWFGVFGISVPVLLLLISFMLTNIKMRILKKSFISISLITIIGSTAATYLSDGMNGIYGSSLGGQFGSFAESWMLSIFGTQGTAVVIVLMIVAWGMYTYKNSAKYIDMFFLLLKNIILIIISPIISWQPKQTKRTTPLQQTSNMAAAAITPVATAIQKKDDTEIIEGFDGQRFTEIENDIYDKDTGELIQQEHYKPEEQSPEDILHPNNGMQNSSRNAVIPIKSTDTYDYSKVVDIDNAVIFNSPIFDTDGIEIDPNDGEFEIRVKEESIIPPFPIDDEPMEVYEPQPLKKSEPDFEIMVTDNDLNNVEPIYNSKESEFDKFEISITDNADLLIDSIPDDENIVITTNQSSEMNDIDNSVFDPTLELSRYKLPPVELLENHTKKVTVTEEELYENKNKILDTLNNFNIQIDKIKATIGPTVTLYEIVPAPGVRISKIKNLEDDIALSLSALGIRIIAPIPGKGTIGIEVPNKNKEIVSMYSVIKSVRFQDSDYDLPVVLGRTIQNEDYVIDLAKMPHLLVAGATGQGKSVGLNAIITSLLYKKHPAELKFVLVDPKKVELTLYSHLEKHFLAKLPSEDEAIITDTQKVIYTLNSLCIEMDNRYDLLKKAKVRNLKEYNQKFTSRHLNPNKGHRFLPYFVVIIDEFADLIMTAGREIETPIARIAQLARAVGIHLVIATQRPTTNIITGLIKANFPARIAFRVTSMIDSRTILDQPGANQLIGRGDMLVSTGSDTTRVQCAFIDTPEVERITEFIGKQTGYGSAYDLPDYSPETPEMEVESREIRRDGLFDEVARYVVTNQQGSASTIQRNFNIGFNRAGRIMDQLERAGIVGKQEGSKPRKVMVSDLSSLEFMLVELDLK